MIEPSKIFALYLKYIDALDKDVANVIVPFAGSVVLKEEQFSATWQALPIAQKDMWLSKFERGYREVANENQAKLTAAFLIAQSKSRRAA